MTDWTFEAAIDAAIVADDNDATLAEEAKQWPKPKLPDTSKLPLAEREAYQAWWERFQAGLHTQEHRRRDYIEALVATFEERVASPFTEDEERELISWKRRLKEVGAFE